MSTSATSLALLGTASFFAVALLTPAARAVAVRYGITDVPGDGKLHSSVTPYLGGVAILLATLGVSAVVPRWWAQGLGIFVGAAVVGLVGLVDDVRTLGPGPRVLMEAVAATAAFLTGARVHIVNDPVDWFLTVLWLVVLTNSFNLLDNMDGAAALIGTATAIAITVLAALGGQVLVGGLAVAVAGACAGFLLYNWHPARIFMGDTGSLFLGFLLSALALKLRFSTGHAAGLVAVALIAAPAIFDTTLVVISRVRSGRSILIGGTDHTSHRLMRMGLSAHLVAGVLAVAAGVCGAAGIAVGYGTLPAVIVVPIAVAGTALLALLLRAPHPTGTVAGPAAASHALAPAVD